LPAEEENPRQKTEQPKAEFKETVQVSPSLHKREKCVSIFAISSADGTKISVGVYEVCSNSIRIGIVVVVRWVGCVCNQS